MKPAFSAEDQVIIKLLKGLESVKDDYPPKLLARRRAAFIKQIAQREKLGDKNILPLQDRKMIKLLKSLKLDNAGYPPKLLAGRRAAFMRQIAGPERVENRKKLTRQNQEVIRLLGNLKSLQPEYPQTLLAERRSALVGHVLQGDKTNWWERLRSGIQNKWISITRPQRVTSMELMRTSLVLGLFIVAVFLGSLIYGSRGMFGTALNDSPTQREVSKPFLLTPTPTLELAKTICKPGYRPPMCLAIGFDKSRDLTFQGNGLARAAVAKDTIPGFSGIHQAAYINDGLYGSGASWVSYSANSWVKIDLGQNTTIDIVKFSKDRLGNFNDHNPGQFTIAVALSDNIYANGDSTNDDNEYKQVYDSKAVGFSGVVSGSETIQATFNPILARYVKITVTNPGAAIDEVEVFYSNQSAPLGEIGRTKESHDSQATSTITPSATSKPTDTPTLISTNTLTPIPTDTPTPIPTDTFTPIPTDTPTSIPTDTPLPVPTDTPMPIPTDTPMPVPTDTPIYLPTTG